MYLEAGFNFFFFFFFWGCRGVPPRAAGGACLEAFGLGGELAEVLAADVGMPGHVADLLAHRELEADAISISIYGDFTFRDNTARFSVVNLQSQYSWQMDVNRRGSCLMPTSREWHAHRALSLPRMHQGHYRD